MSNPHFDDGFVVWNDAYQGRYQAVAQNELFEQQWHMALAGHAEYSPDGDPGMADEDIADRVYEWTAVHPQGTAGFNDPGIGGYVLDHPLQPELISNKRCIDIGSGLGRWTRTMQMLGAAEILSVDPSSSALASLQKFNPNTLATDVVTLLDRYPELTGQFDFANLQDVAMHTHDPAKTVAMAAATLRPGGALYLTVYTPEGIHGQPLANAQRKEFHLRREVAERLQWVDHVHARRWSSRYALSDNLKNVARNVRRLPLGSRMDLLQRLEPEFNWVVPFKTARVWLDELGFGKIVHLNYAQPNAAAHHLLGVKPL